MLLKKKKKSKSWEFPGGPVVRTLHFHYRRHRFYPWSPASRMALPKKKTECETFEKLFNMDLKDLVEECRQLVKE